MFRVRLRWRLCWLNGGGGDEATIQRGGGTDLGESEGGGYVIAWWR